MQQNPNDLMIYPKEFNERAIVFAPVRTPFADETLDFLNEVSKQLMRDPASRRFSDIVTLAFWIRKTSTQKMKDDFFANHVQKTRLGKGIVFHIAPGNVAVNFAYSLFTGLLAGNNNIVKLAPKEFEQTDIILRAIAWACGMDEFKQIAAGLAIIRYAVNDEATAYFSSLCDARVMWGGDATVNAIRRFPLPPRSTEIMFADRYSFCAVKADKLLDADNIAALAKSFYNDTFLMDQNACSSPRLVVWQGSADDVEKAKEKFWTAVHAYAENEYQMEAVMAIDKLTTFMQDVLDGKQVRKETDRDNLIFRVAMDSLPADVENIRCAGGYFVETTVDSLDEIAHIVNKKYQTMTYFGFTQEELKRFVAGNSLRGIDRIVPFGEALSFNLIWDGYDLIGDLSRICDILQ